MMVERAQAKRDAIDTTKAAFDGLKIGLLYVGPVVGLGTFLETKDTVQAATNYGKFGGKFFLRKSGICSANLQAQPY